MVLVVLVVLVVSVVLVVLMVSVLSVVSVIMAFKRKSKPPAKLPVKCKLKNDKNTVVKKVTPAKYKKSFITAPEPLKSVRPALFFCLPALPAYPYWLLSNVLVASSSPMCKIADCQGVCKNAKRQKQPVLSPRASIEKFWDIYKDSHSFTTLTMSANKEKYKITSRYFFYWLNIIVQGIFLDKVKHLFLFLEALFMRRWGNDDVKTRCLLALLREAEYVNKVIHSWLEYYTCK